jgi:hypothetical protein
MNTRTGHWTRGQATILRKLARIADDALAASIITCTESARHEIESDRRFVRVLLLEAETSLRRVIAAEQMKVAGAGL